MIKEKIEKSKIFDNKKSLSKTLKEIKLKI